jgi:NAD(P)H-dependent flavin oxidoreductase YrpB (nitropropane dioxygenase family)/predicted amidohydrolase
MKTANQEEDTSSIPQRFKVAVVQAAPVVFDRERTLEKVHILSGEAARKGARLVLFPEAFVSAYPRGLDFGAVIGSRSEEGREDFRRYWESSVDVPGPAVDALSRTARSHGVYLVVGVVERDRGTLYCSVLFFAPDGNYLGKHRKTMPTASERLVWGFGDGSTMPVFDTPFGKIGAVICWENYLPLMRAAMYAKGIEIYCAPTADARDSWIASVRHIAVEGRCFVLSCNQFNLRRDFPTDYRSAFGDDPDAVLTRGGSCIVDPFGSFLAGPNTEGEAILIAEIDRAQIVRGKFDLDVVGHYARPDIFQLHVDERPKRPVTTHSPEPSGETGPTTPTTTDTTTASQAASSEDRMICTRLTERFGIRHPIICAPMALVTGGALATAVSRAGGLGIVAGGYAGTLGGEPDLEAELVRAKPGKFGVGFITWALARAPKMLTKALQHSPLCVFLSFGDPRPFAAEIRDGGAALICQVQFLSQIDMALEADAAAVVVQGTEAGGHGGNRSTFPFVPEAADYLRQRSPRTLLIAAGGIVDGRGLAAALMLGADGVVVGTRLWASAEALTPKAHTDKAIGKTGDSTIRTKALDALRGVPWPKEFSYRFLKNKLTDEWAEREAEAFRAYGTLSAEYVQARAQNDLDTLAVTCGEAVGLLRNRPTAESIVDSMAAEAASLLRHGGKFKCRPQS